MNRHFGGHAALHDKNGGQEQGDLAQLERDLDRFLGRRPVSRNVDVDAAGEPIDGFPVKPPDRYGYRSLGCKADRPGARGR